MGQERNCGRLKAAATVYRRWDVWTSSWEYVCSGVLDLWTVDKAYCRVVTWNSPRSRPSRLIHRGISRL